MSGMTSAADTYAARRSDIARLLDVLGQELDRHGATARERPLDWSLAGDLGRIREGLVNLVGIMSNMDPHEVEAFLAD